jgi:hypothetical protein
MARRQEIMSFSMNGNWSCHSTTDADNDLTAIIPQSISISFFVRARATFWSPAC